MHAATFPPPISSDSLFLFLFPFLFLLLFMHLFTGGARHAAFSDVNGGWRSLGAHPHHHLCTDQGALGSMRCGGRLLVPTRIWCRRHCKIDANQKRHAVVPAITVSAASALTAPVAPGAFIGGAWFSTTGSGYTGGCTNHHSGNVFMDAAGQLPPLPSPLCR